MSFIAPSSVPTQRTRRWFGVSLGIVLSLFAYGLYAVSPLAGQMLGWVAVLLSAGYYLFPATQVGIIRGWHWLTFPLAWSISHVLLASLFFGIVLPLGLVLRWFGHEPLGLRKAPQRTGWVDCSRPRTTSQYFKQY